MENAIQSLASTDQFFGSCICVELKKNKSIDDIQKALFKILSRNDIFQLRLSEDRELSNIQIVDPDQSNLDIQIEYDLNSLATNKSKYPSCLPDSKLFTFTIFPLADKYIIEGKFNSVIFDEWSCNSFFKQLDTYLYHSDDNIYHLPNNSVYQSYLKSKTSYLQSNQHDIDCKYWIEKFDQLPSGSYLFNNNLIIDGRECSSISFELPQTKTRKIEEFCQKESISIQELYISAIYLYISRIKQVQEVVLGVKMNNHPDGINLSLGDFSSTTPLKIDVDGRTTKQQLLATVTEEFAESSEHRKLSSTWIVEALKKDKQISDNFQLFDFVLSYFEIDLYESFEDIQINHSCSGNYSLSVNICNNKQSNTLSLSFNYLKSLFREEDIRSISASLDKIIDQIIQQSDIPIADFEILSDEEKFKVVELFNRTSADYPREESIAEIFEDYAAKYPEKIASQFDNRSYTYKELNEKANQLAHTLIDLGCKVESRIGIFLDRSPEFIIGLLGILKAGGAYVPIDINASEERIDYVTLDCSIKIILTNNNHIDKLLSKDIIGLEIDSWFNNQNKENPNLDISSENLAYVMYTSGSTGKPKGVMVEQRNVVKLVKNSGFIDADTNTVLLMTGSLVFDAITFEIWITLLNGGKLCIIEEKDLLNLSVFEQKIKGNKVNTLFLTTALLHYITDKNINLFSTLTHLLTGGDILSAKHANLIKSKYPALILSNCYGPTENGCMSTVYTVKNTDLNTIPIGPPIANSSTYILDKNLNPLPVNVAGELCVGGDGVARGYLNDEKTTREKFVKNSFAKGMLYRTGDLAKWQSDGNIVFLGRIDNQIKIRGFRIELGEIEAMATSHPAIEQIFITAIQDANQNKELYLYYTSKGLEVEELRIYLNEKLPHYMVPPYLIHLDSFPLNVNGKIDKNKLPKHVNTADHTAAKLIKPQSETEKKLFDIWEKTFNFSSISVNDDFFALGGHSLRAMQLVDTINQQFNISLDISIIFYHPNIRSLASKIESSPRGNIESIAVLAKREHYPMSYAQKRLFILDQLEGGSSTSYNTPIAFKLGENVSLTKLYYALSKVVDRHDAFRTSFEINGGELVQVIHDKGIISIETFLEEQNDVDFIIRNFIRPFSLDKLPLFRVGIIRTISKENIVLFDFHHIIGDGESLQILLKDIDAFYTGSKPEELKIQYKDYSWWQYEQFQRDSYIQQKEYWLQKLSGELPVLDLPYNRPRPIKQEFEGDDFIFEIEKDLFDKIKSINKSSNTTLYMLLMAAYSILLAKYSLQEDVLVGTPIRGRKHPDADSLLGIFINNIVIRSNPDSELVFKDFLENIKQTIIEAFKNQDFQFEELVAELNVNKDLGRTPIFDTVFVVQEILTKDIQFQNIETLPFDLKNKSAKYDIFFEAYPTTDIIKCVINYSTSLFDQSAIELLSQHFINILRSVTDDVYTKIKDIELLSISEKKLLLHGFNNTNVHIDTDKTIVSLFKQQVENTPHDVAIVFKNKALSYQELDTLSDRLASLILSKGLPQGSLIGLMLSRSEVMFLAQLAILKSGSAYLPIDKEFPKSRIEYMITKGNIDYIITEKALTDLVEFKGVYIIVDDIDLHSLTEINTEDVLIKPESIAYTIFTSGSTGDPKGVQITHRAVVNFIKGVTDLIDFKTNKTILCLTTISFDIYVLESLLALCYGNRVVIADEEEQLDSKLLNRLIIEAEVELLQITPSRLQLISSAPNCEEALSKLKVVMIGGEAIPKHVFAFLKNYSNFKIYNMYGPTETTVWSTIKDLTETEKITIGQPIANTQIYILDKNMLLTPRGVIGELYIGGEGLSPGYFANGKLTAERFIPNPYIEGDLIYQTGDLAKWNFDGEIEFCGRNDFQVKIRGYRIESSEVEEKLKKCNGILECVVVVDTDKLGYNRLVAYYTSETEIDNKIIRNQLALELPTYMIPDILVRIDSIPLTPNNKIDRKKLPKVEDVKVKIAEDDIPQNELQKRLLDIWRNVLGNNQIGIHDAFFELGGNSLSLVIMSNMIEKIFPGKVNVTDIFTYPTIAKLADFINEKDKKQSEKISLMTTTTASTYFSNIHSQKYIENTFSHLYDAKAKMGLEKLATLWKTAEDVVLVSAFAFLLSKITHNQRCSLYVYRNERFYELNFDISGLSKFEDIVNLLDAQFADKERLNSYSQVEVEKVKIQTNTSSLALLFVYGKNPTCSLDAFDIQFRYAVISDEFKIENALNISRLNKDKWKIFFSNYLSTIQQIINQVSSG